VNLKANSVDRDGRLVRSIAGKGIEQMARMIVPNCSETGKKDIKNKRFTVGYLK